MCMAAALPMAGGYLLGRRGQKEEPTITQNFSGFEEESSTEQQSTAPTESNQSSQSSRTTDKAY